jgi:hypothetical protein
MEAILKFELPDDKTNFECATRGSDLALIIWDFDQYLRGEEKYNSSLTECQDEVFNNIREKLREIMSEYGITFDSEIFT